MMLNGGYYGGQQYLNKAVIDQWTKSKSSISRRGLGFDKTRYGKYFRRAAVMLLLKLMGIRFYWNMCLGGSEIRSYIYSAPTVFSQKPIPTNSALKYAQ